MANTYTLIASNTLSSSAASVTFSSIPNTYTDLVLRFSVRTDETATTFSLLKFRYNSTDINYSNTEILGNGASGSSANYSAATYQRIKYSDAVSATSNTFASGELYFPSYTASQNKPHSFDVAHETNAVTAYRSATAGLWRNTAALTAIEITEPSGYSLVSGSSFFLYGIKKS